MCYILLTPTQIKHIVSSISKLPLVVSSAFYKTICNALCTTTAFHSDVIPPCFACGKGSDDQFHFLRCSKIAYIFQFLPAFMHIKHRYFSHQNLARLAVFYEVYYLLTRRYGKSFYTNSNFASFASRTRQLAIHVAIKNRIQYIAKLNFLNTSQVCQYCHNFPSFQHNLAITQANYHLDCFM